MALEGIGLRRPTGLTRQVLRIASAEYVSERLRVRLTCMNVFVSIGMCCLYKHGAGAESDGGEQRASGATGEKEIPVGAVGILGVSSTTSGRGNR